MHIESIEVGNYKCFWKPQKIMLEHGFNLFVGANNSGKTTALEALDLNAAADEPHRSVLNIPKFGGRATGNSRFVVRIATNISELRRLVGDQFYVPLPQNYAPPAGQEEFFAQQIITSAGIVLEVGFEAGVDSHTYETVLGKSGIASRNGPSEKNITAMLLQFSDSGTTPNTKISNFGNIGPQVSQYYEQYRRVIYRFSAQRRPGGECVNSGDPLLDREATNLPYCINHLQSNDAHGHKMLCDWVNRIFPSVKWIQASPTPTNSFQLRCLPTLPEDRRDDLAIPIARMGAGIGNVVAMLYVVLTSRHPQVIAIDEPNSFLHPRALRELLQILATEGKQHQYILTAHSPDVLTAVKPNLITLFEFDGASTTIQQVDAKNISDIRTGLSDLGIRMTDLHGRDQVLWVEGQTEELVMPELLRYFCPEIAAGTAVLRVEHTGAFEKRKGVNPNEVVKIYHRLTASSALVPPMIAILLDSEARKEVERTQLEQDSKGVLRFLDRPMLENYILFPDAIVAVLNGLGENVTIEDVQNALENAGFSGASVVNKIHGANVLNTVFSELSETRHTFNKTRDVPEIISWLIENNAEALRPLGSVLRNVMGLGSSV